MEKSTRAYFEHRDEVLAELQQKLANGMLSVEDYNKARRSVLGDDFLFDAAVGATKKGDGHEESL